MCICDEYLQLQPLKRKLGVVSSLIGSKESWRIFMLFLKNMGMPLSKGNFSSKYSGGIDGMPKILI
jgi:hypothetical protein